MAVVESAPPRRGLRLPPAGHLAAGLGAFALAVVPLLFLKFHSGKFPVDLAVYREAGRVVLRGGNPYAPAFGRNLRIPLPFTYPPFAAAGAVAVGVLSEPVALIAWTAVSLAALLALVGLAFGPVFEGAAPWAATLSSRWRWAVVGLAAGALAWTIPLNETISFGQVNLLLALACVLDCGVVPALAPRRRGVLVGIATAVKLTPGVFILYFAVTRQWAAALRAVVTTVLCELVAAAVLPGPSRQYWFHLFFSPSRTGDPTYFTNQSLYGTVSRLHLPPLLWPPLAVAAGALGMWRAARAHREALEVAAVALVGLTAVLVSPIAWQHHGVWIVLMVGVLAAWATTPWRVAATLGVLAFFLQPLPLFGKQMVVAGTLPILGKLLENSYVLAYVALIALLPLAGPKTAGRLWRFPGRG